MDVSRNPGEEWSCLWTLCRLRTLKLESKREGNRSQAREEPRPVWPSKAGSLVRSCQVGQEVSKVVPLHLPR